MNSLLKLITKVKKRFSVYDELEIEALTLQVHEAFLLGIKEARKVTRIKRIKFDGAKHSIVDIYRALDNSIEKQSEAFKNLLKNYE